MSSRPSAVGRYEILAEIGRGGMGTLYRAWDPKLDRQIAIKVLNRENDELRERFAREARAAARLEHPHIVTIFDVGEDEGRPYIAMEFIQGQTLADLIRSGAPLAKRRKLELVEELCAGLAFAHRAGIIHRDVKPANVMVGANGQLKILDFGIARATSLGSMTKAGVLIGTVNYMSPEQIAGQEVDHRSDIFAVGALFYEVLSYRQAFPGGLDGGVLHRILHGNPEPLESVCREVDPEVAKIVARCLEKSASKRYQDLGPMIKDLQRVQMGLAISDDETMHTDESLPIPRGRVKLTPTLTVDSSRRSVDRAELTRRRASQIQAYLETAEKAIASGDHDAGIAACEEILLRDAENSRALELIERARAELDKQEAEEWLSEAERELRRGALTAALTLIDRAAAVNPSSARVAELRRAAEEALRERERIRQRAEAIRRILERAHAAFDKGQFEEAAAAASEALGLDADSFEARTLKSRSADAIDAREHAELERRARESVREARRLFGSGSHDTALDLLSRFQPPHHLVSQALDQLRADAARIEDQRRIEGERRAKQQRIAAELQLARGEIGREEFAEALERMLALTEAEGPIPEAAPLIKEAEAGQAERERLAHIVTEVSGHVARAAGLFARNDLSGALSRVDAALELDPTHSRALSLRAKIQESLRVAAERRQADERRAHEREHAVKDALEKALRAPTHEAAVAALNDAIELDPDHVEARRLLERHREAILQEQAEHQRLLEADKRRREQIRKFVQAAEQSLRSGDTDSARRAARSALELDPDNADAQFLMDEIADAELRRRDLRTDASSGVGQLSAGGSSRTVEPQGTASARGSEHVQGTATGTSAQVARKRSTRDRLTGQRRSILLLGWGSAGLTILGLLVAAYVFRGGPVPVDQAASTSATAQSQPSPSQPPQQPEPPAEQAPAGTENPAATNPGSNVEGQLAELRGRARDYLARGDWQQFLAAAGTGLQVRPADPELQKMLRAALNDARSGLARERAAANATGPSAVRSSAYRAATVREREALQLERAGSIEAAVRASREAAALFQQAGVEGRALAASAPAPGSVASPPGGAAGRGLNTEVAPAVAAAPPPPAAPTNVPSTPANTAAAPATNPATTSTPAPSSPAAGTPQSTPAATPPIQPPVATPAPSTQAAPAADAPPAKTPPPAQPPSPTQSEEPAIRNVVAAYAAAYSNLDAGAVKRVYPSVNEQELRRRFAGLRSQRMQIQNEQITTRGNSATVSGTVETVSTGQVGGQQRDVRRVELLLEKTNGVWTIVERR